MPERPDDTKPDTPSQVRAKAAEPECSIPPNGRTPIRIIGIVAAALIGLVPWAGVLWSELDPKIAMAASGLVAPIIYRLAGGRALTGTGLTIVGGGSGLALGEVLRQLGVMALLMALSAPLVGCGAATQQRVDQAAHTACRVRQTVCHACAQACEASEAPCEAVAAGSP